ncbi:unnamed protein product [Polarella glacialis]|nr:unnamed protein product [Polarella glacialis]
MVIRSLRPDHVGLELCARRFRRLFPMGLAAFAALPEDSQKQLAARLAYGKEQLEAASVAHELGLHVALCDRDVRVTEARFLSRLPPEALLAGSCAALGLSRAAAIAATLNRAQGEHGSAAAEVEQALEEAVKACVLDERDLLLGARLRCLPGRLVLGVVGSNHIDGVTRQWNKVLTSGGEVQAFSQKPHLPVWRRLLGSPLLWRLRGTFG